MNKDKVNSNSNEQTIKSNCSIMSLLRTTPQGQMFTDGVAYTSYDIEKEKGLVIEGAVQFPAQHPGQLIHPS